MKHWSELTTHDLPLLGGKAKNLFLLSSQGFPVPNWWVLVSDDELELSKLDSQKIFSVRSSAQVEDAHDHSFAGMFETKLYVAYQDLPQAVQEVRSSLNAPRVQEYLKEKNISSGTMSVIVQEMIDAKSSGVMFTSNPAGKLDELVIVAAFGVGEGVVAELADCDTFFMSRWDRSIRKIIIPKYRWMEKKLRTVTDPMSQPVLSDDQLIKLFEWGLKLEHFYNREQDIEWAIDPQGNFFLLQSRPITTIPAGPWIVYDNSNVVESYPGIVLPMTFSLTKMGYEHTFSGLGKLIGLPQFILDRYQNCFQEMIVTVQGRVFYNMNNWNALLKMVPFYGNNLVRYFEEMIGSDQVSLKKNFSFIRFLENIYVSFSLLVILPWRFLNLKNILQDYHIAMNSLLKSEKNNLLSSMSITENYQYLLDFRDDLFAQTYKTQINDFFLMIFFGVTRKLFSKLKVKDPENIFNGHFCGLDGLESVLPVRSMMLLAMKVKKNPAALATMLHDPDFLKHIELYGDRTLEELKFEVLSFREQPEKLLAIIKRYADANLDPEKMREHELALLQDSEKQLSEALKGRRFLSCLITRLIPICRRLLFQREKARLDRARYFGVVRQILRALGKKLFKNVDDIFYFTLWELEKIVTGTWNTEMIDAHLCKMKKTYDEYRQKNPQGKIVIKENYRNLIPQKEVAVLNASGQIRGLGSSPGIVEGIAAVITDPHQAKNFEGKILITEMTDPGWVFLMVAAKALVVEKGSLLSHTAIIGRELGIPTIVGVKNAMSLIPDGATIKVDGQEGVVYVLKHS